MSDAEITGNIAPKRKIIMSLYWINRKCANVGGCDQFLIKKIVTENETYRSTEDKFLKLSPNVLNDVLHSMESQKKVEFEIKLGTENIKLSIYKNVFSISAISKDLEREIGEKLESEGRKMYPSICSKFPSRIGVTTFP